VAYELPGVRQVAVDERHGLDFSRGLDLLLAHDPDRIFVGELRDAATAQRALHAALAGCAVVATVQARDIVDTLGGLRQLGLDMVAALSVLSGVVVQRLLRGLCGECRGTRETTAPERAWLASLGQPDVARVARAVGCEVCHQSGYRGRLLLTEVHLIDDAWRDVVARGCVPSYIRRHACTQGVLPLAEQAARRVRSGDLTIEEMRRVLSGSDAPCPTVRQTACQK
jgi:general secretion pathway protein E